MFLKSNPGHRNKRCPHLNSDWKKTIAGSHQKLYSYEWLTPRGEAGWCGYCFWYLAKLQLQPQRFHHSIFYITLPEPTKSGIEMQAQGRQSTSVSLPVDLCPHTARTLPSSLLAPVLAYKLVCKNPPFLPKRQKVNFWVSFICVNQLWFSESIGYSLLVFPGSQATSLSILLCPLCLNLGWHTCSSPTSNFSISSPSLSLLEFPIWTKTKSCLIA